MPNQLPQSTLEPLPALEAAYPTVEKLSLVLGIHSRSVLPDRSKWRCDCTCGYLSDVLESPGEALTHACPVEEHLRESLWRREQLDMRSR